MMTLEEYVAEKNRINKKVYEILKDDARADVVYELLLLGREKEDRTVCCGIFKKFANLELEMDRQIEFIRWPDDDGNFNDDYNEKDYAWFVVDKFRLAEGEYKKELKCQISFDKKLLNYSCLSDVVRTIDIPSSKEVTKAYNTGDILKVRNKPLTDDFYVIYIYDENREGNKHIQMCYDLDIYDEEFTFCKIHWLELTEKVGACPDARINEMSKRLKDNPDEAARLIELHKISTSVYPSGCLII